MTVSSMARLLVDGHKFDFAVYVFIEQFSPSLQACAATFLVTPSRIRAKNGGSERFATATCIG